MGRFVEKWAFLKNLKISVKKSLLYRGGKKHEQKSGEGLRKGFFA